MEARGFDREYRTRRPSRRVDVDRRRRRYRDVDLDVDRRTITLRRPLVLDLGAVAKGFAIDMAARELAPFGNFAIDAGGDLYLGGHNDDGEPWSVGIRHPRDEARSIEHVRVSDAAVCTSGDYLRRPPDGEHHIIDPHTGASAAQAASATVVGAARDGRRRSRDRGVRARPRARHRAARTPRRTRLDRDPNPRTIHDA